MSNDSTLPYLSSSRTQMGALGHNVDAIHSAVCRQFFGFVPGDVRVLQISSDDVHPIFPWASSSSLSLVAPCVVNRQARGYLNN